MRRGTRGSSESKTAGTEKLREKLKGKLLSDVFKKADDLAAPWEPISTGFKKLDDALNGGLIPELYVLGAESSTGKSTFMLNMAEKIAAAKIPVMYFSLEMPSDYIARLIICHCLIEKKGELSKSLEMKNFTKKDAPERLKKEFGKGKNSPFDIAFADYQRLGKSIRIIERDKENSFFNAKNIYNEVEKFKKQNKNQTPVVIVDYLQILDGEKDKYPSDQRSVVDFNIGFLSQTANELKAPVIAISSLNRDSYKGKSHDISLSSFKESGRIEYSADVVWALQTERKSDGEFKKHTLKLRILKNRYGEKDVNAWLSFYPEFGLFEDGEEPETQENQDETVENSADEVSKVQVHEQARNSEEAVEETVEEAVEDAANLKYMSSAKIVRELRKKTDNSGFHGKLIISGKNKEKRCVAYYLRKKCEANDGAESLTLWDLAVMDTIYAVTDKGKKTSFTISELYKFMCGKSKLTNRSEQITKKFENALQRLKNREMFIDITEELIMREGDLDKNAVEKMIKKRKASAEELNLIPEFNKKSDENRTIIKGTLLPFKIEGARYCLLDDDMPFLFDYSAKISTQFIRYDPKLWSHIHVDGGSEKEKHFTMQKLLIRYYLIEQIGFDKFYLSTNSKTYSPSKAIEESLLPLLARADNSLLKRSRYHSRWLKSALEDAEMILKDLKDHGYISEPAPNPEREDKLAYKIIRTTHKK